jgi:hypothetical protein
VAGSWQARADGYQVPPTYGNADGNHDLRAGGGEFCQLSIFAKLVCQTIGGHFSCFVKIRWMPSWFAKLL